MPFSQPVKDYYSTLQIAPQASASDIKRAYRRMALKYHPDKQQNDLYAAAYFQEIQEAYRVLIDPLLRAQYHQQRWLTQSNGRKYQEMTPATPLRFAQACASLYEYVVDQDEFRINRPALVSRLLSLLSDQEIQMIHHFQDPGTINRCMDLLERICQPLEWEDWLICKAPLTALAANNDYAQTRLQKIEQRIQWKKREQQYRWIALLAGTLLVCGLIWWFTQ